MIELQVEHPVELLKSLTDMLHQLQDFPTEMAQEMTDWQTADMHRQYPYTSLHVSSADHAQHHATVSTVIWPRGLSKHQGDEKRAEMADIAQNRESKWVRQTRRAVGSFLFGPPKRRRKIKTRIKRITRRTYRGSHRPVLREVLFDKLVTRMGDLLETIHWQ